VDVIVDGGMMSYTPDMPGVEVVDLQSVMKSMEDAKALRLKRIIRSLQAVNIPANVTSLVDDLRSLSKELGLMPAVSVTHNGISTAFVREPVQEMGEKSRISAWRAYQRGVRLGDDFKIRRVSRRQYRANRKTFTNLTEWVKENHPNSETAKLLRLYHQI
jgi:hypothetical protein